MEVRGNLKAELASVEQQLAVLSSPRRLDRQRPCVRRWQAQAVRPGIWEDSHECANIQESGYFAKACGQVVQLRRELAAAQDYERLSVRAGELRKSLSAAPIVATSDPLPAAFSATLGRLVPIRGTEGVALLLTMVVEIISCFGLAALSALAAARDRQGHSGSSLEASLAVAEQGGIEGDDNPQQTLPQGQLVTLPKPSLKAAVAGRDRCTQGG